MASDRWNSSPIASAVSSCRFIPYRMYIMRALFHLLGGASTPFLSFLDPARGLLSAPLLVSLASYRYISFIDLLSILLLFALCIPSLMLPLLPHAAAAAIVAAAAVTQLLLLIVAVARKFAAAATITMHCCRRSIKRW